MTKPHRPPIRFSRLPAGVQHAGAGRIERQQPRATVTDLLHVTDAHWSQGHYRFLCIQHLDKQLGRRLQVSSRTVERWLRIYRKDPDVMALMPRARGPSIGHRRITPERENLLAEVIDAWARRGQRLPVAWIREECGHRGRALGIKPVSRGCIEARLRDLGIESLQRVRPPRAMPAGVPTRPPRSKGALGIVQIDHTLVDVMVVDEVRRQSMGRPWITVAFDIATRAVLGFHLSLNAPSSISVGLTLAMVGLPKERWLVERGIEVEWPMFGIPRLLHLDNGAEFHSVALSRGCERYGISLEYRPPGRPHFGGHIERWIALEIAGRYHFNVHRGLHAVPYRLWKRTVGKQPRITVPAPDQSEYLSIPYSDLRRPPITLAELERARSILTAKGDSQPSEEQLFATAEQQRHIEDAAARRSRTARRNTERRPSRRIAAGRIRKGSPVNYEEKVVPYKGEVW